MSSKDEEDAELKYSGHMREIWRWRGEWLFGFKKIKIKIEIKRIACHFLFLSGVHVRVRVVGKGGERPFYVQKPTFCDGSLCFHHGPDSTSNSTPASTAHRPA
jgi:hypothetical protein